MFLLAQLVLAILLVTVASLLVVIWLLLLALAYIGDSGLMPWVAAGIILYGFIFIATAAMVGIPGIVWANHLSNRVPSRWMPAAKMSGRIGKVVLILGFVVALAVLVGEQLRPKNPEDGRVTYRNAASASAIEPSAAESSGSHRARE